jgi:hypothetical protein
MIGTSQKPAYAERAEQGSGDPLRIMIIEREV